MQIHSAVRRVIPTFLFLVVFISNVMVAQKTDWQNLDTVKAGKFDMGRMWTFDFPPTTYFNSTYKFLPTNAWYDNVRMSALRFADYCSASFVSADGLVMTNHHCGRESISKANKPGEDLHENGFIATTLEEERKIPGLFVDQLVSIKDVTADVQKAFDSGKTDDEKVKNRKDKIKELENSFTEKTLKGQVITFFNGGKYSLYGFKTYNDVRLVFAPETQMGFFGGDPDNFTYPRYNLDCTFFRVYGEDGKPLVTKNFYKWSPNGAMPGEPVFVVGNPGSTNRLSTVSQLEFNRDYQAPFTLALLDGLVDVYSEYLKENPKKKDELQDKVFSFQNGQKSYVGILGGLRDPIFFAKKVDFERTLKEKIMASPKLKAQYGDLWDKIAEIRAAMSKISRQATAFRGVPLVNSEYFSMASEIVKIAKQISLPDSLRDFALKGLNEGDIKTKKFFSPDFDASFSKIKLAFNVRYLEMLLGKDDPALKIITGGKSGKAAVDNALINTVFKSQATLDAFLAKGSANFLKSSDPFIKFVAATMDSSKVLGKMLKDLSIKEADYSQKLGRAVFEVYGTTIPPDATFSLRIADGIVDGYNYNGTIAPPFSTFYGMYERYYAFGKKFPWSLPKRWETPPAGFDLSTPFNFVSTNDIIGGNSGSPVINKNAEIVGLAFDGNMESLPGQFIFDTKSNRTVNVHSSGMVEAIRAVYNFTRLAKELRAGKIVE